MPLDTFLDSFGGYMFWGVVSGAGLVVLIWIMRR